MGKIAFVFPGQGSQAVGMGMQEAEANQEAKELLNEADRRLGYSLTTLIAEGPIEKLTRTENAQPALLATSLVLMQRLNQAGISPDYTAGHSLGEYTALVASGAMTFSDGVYAVRQRGLYMEEAVPDGQGAMAAVLGMERDSLKKICANVSEEGGTVQLANINCPGQIVISGTAEGVEKASGYAKEQGAKRVMPLQVSGPFHSTLMKPAAEKFKQVLDGLSLNDAEIPVVINVTASPETKEEIFREKLIEQLYSPVLWEDSVRKLISLGVDTFVEIGPGKVLSGLIRKIDRNVNTISVQDPEGIQSAIQTLKGE